MGKTEKDDYKTVRIYLDDFEEYRKLAFYEDTTIIQSISRSLACYKHYMADENPEGYVKHEKETEQDISMDESSQHEPPYNYLLEDINLDRREHLLWIKERYIELAKADDDINITREQFQKIFGINEREYYGIVYATILHGA